jgi:hypothetical protein
MTWCVIYTVSSRKQTNATQINLYEPAILVVGTRGKSLGGFQGLLPGSVSKYCLQHSPVPVIVVRPSSKRDKARNKRANDPDRLGYKEMLAKSESLIDVSSSRSNSVAPEEHTTVASGFGNVQPPEPSPLAQVHHAENSDDDREITMGIVVDVEDPRSPGALLKSPHLQNLDSPDLSSESSSEEDEEDEEDEGGVPTTTEAEASGPYDTEGDTGGFNLSSEDMPPPWQPPTPEERAATSEEKAKAKAAKLAAEAASYEPAPKSKKPTVDHKTAAQRIMKGI